MFHWRSKKIFLIIAAPAILFLGAGMFYFFKPPIRNLTYENSKKLVYLNDNGLNFEFFTRTNTITEVLKENNIILNEHDQVIPESEEKIYTGTNILIRHATRIRIDADKKNMETFVLGKTVAEALYEKKIILSRLDKVSPSGDTLITNDLQIKVTRINVEEVSQKEDVPFKTVVKNDSKLGWQEKKIENPGQLGEKEVQYKITYKDSKEISRVILKSEITIPPSSQIEIHGTYMQLGKAVRGQGTWYAYQGGMFAASTTIPRGAYAKVTNTENGKSIVVQINDYGPQGKGRIIDLDKVAFAKIASLGAGVIGVKVEQILN